MVPVGELPSVWGTHCSSQLSCVVQNGERNCSYNVVPSTGVPSGFAGTTLRLTDLGHLESSGIRYYPDQNSLDQRSRNPSQPEILSWLGELKEVTGVHSVWGEAPGQGEAATPAATLAENGPTLHLKLGTSRLVSSHRPKHLIARLSPSCWERGRS